MTPGRSPRPRTSGVLLIHWNAEEGSERIERLRAAGYRAACAVPKPGFLRELARRPPSAVIIDLDRLPMQGRDVGLAIRQRASTRCVPLVFAGGEDAKVERVRASLPDATFAPWSRIGSALRRAIARPPADPQVPSSILAGYSGTPLPRKLGIKPDALVVLIGAPAGFPETLGPLPSGVRLVDRHRADSDLALWFVRSRRDLERGIERMAGRLQRGSLWICWPKKASAMASDVSETEVRRAGLAAGLVDYKICAVDATWSGLLFTRRK